MTEPRTAPATERIATVLLAVAAAALVAAAVAGIGWYRAAGREIGIGDLTPQARQEIAAELMQVSPGIHATAWFHPPIAYTLHPDAELEAWNDRFHTNELGYRTHPAAKAEGVFRVLFVGDSWTYGMGVRQVESFPQLFEEIVGDAAPERWIEAWTLALPGYNTFNYLGALWYFYDRLEPDAVVIAPTTNDHHSAGLILPNGAGIRDGGDGDDFGDEHIVTYRVNHHDSFRARQRWDMSMAAIRDTELRLREKGVPTMLFFVARWHDTGVHDLIVRAGIEAPYMVVPIPLTLGEWVNPPPMDHGNPAANRVYAQAVYRGLARLLDWPEAAETSPEALTVPYYEGPPAGTDWGAAATRLLRGANRRFFAPDWRADPDRERQIAGPHAVRIGEFGRATTILVNRRQGSARLRITVARLEDLPSLYPLGLEVNIPSASGGTRAATVVPADGPPEHTFTVAIPGDVPPGAALDVRFRTERVVADRGKIPVPRSLAIREIEQLD